MHKTDFRIKARLCFPSPGTFAGFLGLLLIIGCQRKPAAISPPPPMVTVNVPLQRTVSDSDEYTGHLQSPETASIAARVSGFIVQAPFKEGTLVHKGDILFVIDDRPFKADLDNKRATVAKDQAQVELTLSQLNRVQGLLKTKVLAAQDSDTATANYQQAQAQLASDKAAEETSELNLEWTRVTAPINGRIGRIEVTVGNLVNGGAGQTTQLTSIVSVDPIYCYVPVPERSFLKYQAYAAQQKKAGVESAKIPCFVELENETNFPHEGVIDFVDNIVDTNTGTIQVRGVIQNPAGALTPGLFSRMRIAGSRPYQTLLVPDLAIGTNQNERYLLIVGPDNVVAFRPVKLGELFGGLRSITEGLKTEDRVVVDGLQQARPGTKVDPHLAAMPEEYVAALDKLQAEVGKGTGEVNGTASPAATPEQKVEANR